MASAAVASSSSSPTTASPDSHSSVNNDRIRTASSNDSSSSPTMVTATTTTATKSYNTRAATHDDSKLKDSVEQKPSAAAPAVNGTATKSTSSAPSDGPLPHDLRRILVEVAKTGNCPWLPWESAVFENHHKALSAAACNTTTTTTTTNSYQDATTTATTVQHDASHDLEHAPSAAAASSSSKQPLAVTRQGGGSSALKKHRNGMVHKNTAASSRMRFGNLDGAVTTSHNSGRKRPRHHCSSAPSSVGTAGSEPDDGSTTLYECDSEGTSVTTNSEVSLERSSWRKAPWAGHGRWARNRRSAVDPMSEGRCDNGGSPGYKTLQAAFRTALGLVLDHFYHTRGGYKLSPAERRRKDTLAEPFYATNENHQSNSDDANKKLTPLSPEDFYLERREKLMMMLLLPGGSSQADGVSNHHDESFDPPFTIQRVAEVLIAPERYYTQTHKLCNCFEKLLLVTSSSAAFGGITGGDTSQSRLEERELAALAEEKGKQATVLRQKRLQWKTSSPTDELLANDGSDGAQHIRDHGSPGRVFQGVASSSTERSVNEGHAKLSGAGSDSASREQLEAAARASLRTKFDHVGIDPHHLTNARDVRAIAEDRGMTNSPPPPSLAMSAAATLAGHGGVAGFVMQHHPEHSADHRSPGHIPSPILFSHGNDHSHLTEASNRHMLQLHHAVSAAGAPLNRNNLELMDIGAGSRTHHGPGSADNADGRSSTSNSDIDSESDDISFDDSASDRSDGSDYGSGPHFEPSTPARAMALNRIQQQRRLENRALTAASLQHQNEGYRPPADTEYQSGDSIDSTRAEDSGGSDSSCSDMAD